MSDAEFRRSYHGTALMRAGRAGIVRNAALVLGNQRAVAALPALRRCLADADPVVRESARWALARIQGDSGVADAGDCPEDAKLSGSGEKGEQATREVD
jgi:epoxyqueuosine reductase